MKLFDSEWKVMEVLWQKNDRTANFVCHAAITKAQAQKEEAETPV